MDPGGGYVTAADWIIPLAAAAVGGVFGWRVSMSRWLGSVRRDAYAGVLRAHEDAVEALQSYLRQLKDALEAMDAARADRPGRHGLGSDAAVEAVRNHLEPYRAEVDAAQHRFDRATDQLVLVGSRRSDAITEELRLDNAGSPTRDIVEQFDRERQRGSRPMLQQIVLLEQSWVRRNLEQVPDRRRRFIARARRDLGVPLEPRVRLRRWGSRIRGRVYGTSQWLWRRTPGALRRRVDWAWKERWARRIQHGRRHRREAQRRREGRHL